MRILNWLKSKLSRGLSIEELRKIPLMNKKWIWPRFEFPFIDSIFSQLCKLHPEGNPTREEAVIGVVYPNLGELGRIKIPACSVDKKADPPAVFLVLQDRNKGDEELDFRLSPIEMVKYEDCFASVKGLLYTIFGLENIRTRGILMTFYFGGG